MHRASRRRFPLLWPALVAALGLAVALFLEAASRVDPDRLAPAAGPLVTDRHGRILRLVPEAEGRKLVPLPPGPLPAQVVKAFLAAEDQRFFQHPGVDFLAVLRAVLSNLAAGRVVSGASTLTMQLTRLAYPGPRTVARKLTEMARSLRLEMTFGKEELLRHYLNRVPLGNNLMGVESAALAYFGKPAAQLSVAEAATLAALAKAPGRLNPMNPHPDRLLARRNWVLGRMVKLGWLTGTESAAAKDAPLTLAAGAPRFPFAAPHLVNLVLARQPGLPHRLLKTTLDLDLQCQVEAVLKAHRPRIRKWGASQAALVVVDNRQAEVLALAGSLEYGARDQGMVNGAAARRSPGSTLKPFLYALALDQGFTPATLLEDVERRYRIPGGEFTPLNFDRVAHGPVSFREALGNSLNLSAVRLLEAVGPGKFYELLQHLSLINYQERGPRQYGLGLVVGNPEVTLLQLTQAYVCLAHGGLFRPLRLTLEDPPSPPRRVFSPQAAYIVTHILADPVARGRIFGASQAMNPPFPLAIKTGTSTRYRDCWAVGVSRDYTLAVWVGNFDGRPTHEGSGASVAAPLLADLAGELCRHALTEPFPRPPGIVSAVICAFSGHLPGAGCRHQTRELFIAGTEPTETCRLHQSGEPWHRLPSTFAGWLHDRHLKDGAGRYRLAGFAPDLERLFGHPSLARLSSPSSPGTTSGPSFEGHGIPRPGAPAGEVAIIAPLRGDHYVLLGSEAFRLTAKAVCQRPLPAVTWLLNGRETATVGPPYEVELELPRGRHRLAAVGPNGLGEEVEVQVE